ncbi:MAG: hypothetical protein ACR2K4_06690 [Candidatus Limnocylindria bacterium]
MTPNDWAETEARRAERAGRADHPHGRDISPRSRRVVGWILAMAALALMGYALLGWLGFIAVPGFGS